MDVAVHSVGETVGNQTADHDLEPRCPVKHPTSRKQEIRFIEQKFIKGLNNRDVIKPMYHTDDIYSRVL